MNGGMIRHPGIHTMSTPGEGKDEMDSPDMYPLKDKSILVSPQRIVSARCIFTCPAREAVSSIHAGAV